MRAIARIMELLAGAEKHQQYSQSVGSGSIVAVAHFSVHVQQDIRVESLTAESITLSDGQVYSSEGALDLSFTKSRFIIEPHELSREQIVKKSLRKQLEEFPWKELTVEHLDAVLKYASMKKHISPLGKHEPKK